MLDLEESSLQHGLLALVIALLEVIKDALVHAAVRRVEGGRLSEAEVERLGDALAELEEAVAQMKNEHGIEDAVRGVRDDLDQVVGRLVDTLAGRETEPLAAEPVPVVPAAAASGEVAAGAGRG